MRTVGDIYEHYKIMPQLRLHQLRVAAVAFLLCDAHQEPVRTRDVVLTCLFHDMGNIIKSDFDQFPDSFRGPQKREYWEEVKGDFVQKYGSSAHQANLAIARELGLSLEIVGLMDDISFSRLKKTRDDGSHEQKISEYADLRVGPHGVMSLEERIADMRARYAGEFESVTSEDENRFLELKQAAHDIERQIFEMNGLRPSDISDESIAILLEELHGQELE